MRGKNVVRGISIHKVTEWYECWMMGWRERKKVCAMLDRVQIKFSDMIFLLFDYLS